MKDFSWKTKLYLYVVYAAGLILIAQNLLNMRVTDPTKLGFLCVLATLALIFKVEGTTNRSHYAISFVVYAFTFTQMGLPAAIITILVSNLVAWMVEKSPWFIQLFNAGCYIIVLQAGQIVFGLVNPAGTLTTWQGALGILVAMALFTFLNHTMVGLIVWLARGENFTQSGANDFLTFMIDLTLLVMGASLSIVWDYNPFAVLLFAIPLYLLYSTLKVPALERQVEIDHKTGLYNLYYFSNQLVHELDRANRFDRPLSVIMADLDFLRNINNTYGHLAGDEILVGIARILKKSVREYDVVARFGGEEFSIMMPETSIARAFERAETIRKEIERTNFAVSTSVTPVKVTMSFGIAGRERFDQESKEILHNADLALYQAKYNGRNRVYACLGEEFINYSYENTPAVNLPDPTTPAVPAPPLANPAVGLAAAPVTRPAADQPAPPAPAVQHEPKRRSDIPVDTVSLSRRKTLTNRFTAGTGVVALILFGLVSLSPAYPLTALPLVSLFGLLVFTLFVVAAEWFSMDIYIHNGSISTSAAPLLAGTLLFGPIGALVLSVALAFTAYLKNKSPVSRFFFNASNQIIACMVYLGLISLIGSPLASLAPVVQLIIILFCSQLVFVMTTTLVAVGISLHLQQSFTQIWAEQFRWLTSFYLIIGFMAYAITFGYLHANIIGMVTMIVPLGLLRYYQKQSLDRTRTMVTELREKNASLQKSSEEISGLSQALLETLAEMIDLRDPYLSGHSRHVTTYANQIARRMGLSERQIEVIRKASLLHDIGKLGIPEALLGKPARLTEAEFAILRKHPEMGAQLLEKSQSLRSLIPVVRYHHEFYDGRGYPDGLKGDEIPIEARVVSVADAIEAMASDRPYRKGRELPLIIDELERCAGTQFDPRVVEVAIRMLEATGDGILARTTVNAVIQETA